MYDQVLQNLGLSPEQTAIYLTLLEKGPQGASQLAKNTQVKRTYVYNVVKSLASLGLASQEIKGKIATFSAASPDHLLTIAETQKQKANQAQQTLEASLTNLQKLYSAQEVRPVIRYYQGLTGIQKIYDDIIYEGQDIILFRSLYDDSLPELNSLLARQIKRQINAGIHVHTVTPYDPETTRRTFLELDPQRLIHRHIVASHKFALPAQIIIYGPKVALISLKRPQNLISTLIDNQDIANTLRVIFDYIWHASTPEHEHLVKSWQSTTPLPPLPQPLT